MKKILLSSLLGAFLCVIYISGGLQVIYASCSWSEGGSVGGQFDNCLSGTQLVNSRGDMSLTGGFKTQVTKWTTNVATLLGLLAIGAIVYGGLLMTLSAGEEEKVKKGKDIVKWSLLGFLALILAGALVRIVIEFIFAVSG
ncbi:hypothetical protein LAT59_03320 [Candidatus Gracilibacteria bacterium]|nr:hypothetical protein [Candidatus Gracilibacteria bacterium]